MLRMLTRLCSTCSADRNGNSGLTVMIGGAVGIPCGTPS
jgi:hypothetical protein